MHKNDWLDHSGIYSQQHQKLYRWVLYSVIIFFLLVSLFLTFTKEEVFIRTSAQLTATKTEDQHMPLETKIKVNNLEENQEVKKGEILVTFDSTALQNKKEQLEQENMSPEEQSKVVTLANIDEQINQLKKEVEKLKAEQARLVSQSATENETNIQIEKGK